MTLSVNIRIYWFAFSSLTYPQTHTCSQLRVLIEFPVVSLTARNGSAQSWMHATRPTNILLKMCSWAEKKKITKRCSRKNRVRQKIARNKMHTVRKCTEKETEQRENKLSCPGFVAHNKNIKHIIFINERQAEQETGSNSG